MAEDSAQDRDLPASAKRRQQAREKGQVARSRDLSSSLLMLASAAAVYYGGAWFFGQGMQVLHEGLNVPAAVAHDPGRMLEFAATIARDGLVVALPLLLLSFVVCVAGGVALGGWVFSLEALAPDFTRLDPVVGIQRMFSLSGLVELGKAMLKTLVIGSLLGWVLWSQRGALLSLLGVAPSQAPALLGSLCGHAFFWLATATLLVAGVDVPWQIVQLNKKLKMSRQDMKDEMRESEGNPEVRQRLRSLQRERARRRMMAAVPKADVVVTNPTHYAVALGYEQGHQRAPVVLAMGADRVAARIRELAVEHGVAVVEAPPLARALYRYAELEQEIPVKLYNAVALLLAYVYQLRALPQQARAPADWAIPADLDTSADTAMPVH
ncbi:flagellar biosynthesis protein FlhB [Thiomonas sp.]|jgi:flagellar biosynthetic protein FlhB|uniref:flagellar biosynthesis protein FlhB n=1 Tax=Thiomonas sp. TaxID=2047785 RepID=UPI0026334126|nr:flagellar biosynthesis protein FlhB [Thiomonas sp.]